MPPKPNQRSNFRKPKKVLVVDDNPHILRGIERTRARVEGRGHRVHTAANYEEAVRKIREQRPDIVLSDFQLSRDGPTGLHIAREAKRVNPEARVRIHSLAAQDLKKAESVLTKFGLRKKNIYSKAGLGRLLWLPKGERVYFAPDVLDAIAKDRKHFPGGVIKFGVETQITEIAQKARNKEVVFVGKESIITKTLSQVCSVMNIKFSRIENISQAIDLAQQGKTLMTLDIGEKKDPSGSARHDAGHILNRVTRE
jgi:CheY-like chemotaxis protein